MAASGWRAVAVDLRGHGASPWAADADLDDLSGDLRETLEGLLGPGEQPDVLLGHSLGALAAIRLCERREERVRRLVLEEPPGPESTDFEEVARGIEDYSYSVRAASASPGSVPSWSWKDSANNVLGLRDCDTGPVAGLLRGLDYDLPGMAGALAVPTLLVLGREEQGSALPEPERSAVAGALRQGTAATLAAGHAAHREDFGGYTRLLGGWLGRPAT